LSLLLIVNLPHDAVVSRRVNAGVMPLLNDMKIRKEQVMTLLLKACPSFTQTWEEHRAFYDDEDLLYVDLGEFAHHLVELHQTGQSGEFPAVFEVIERLHLAGDV
jgi:hypothetical protein